MAAMALFTTGKFMPGKENLAVRLPEHTSIKIGLAPYAKLFDFLPRK